MFTKEDYKEYFEQIGGKEREMFHFLKGLLDTIEDTQIKGVIEATMRDEVRHISLSEELVALLGL